ESPILFVKRLVGDIYLMRMHCPFIAETVLPGQFVNIKVNDELIPLLRKPFSVCRRSKDEGWIEVLWKIVGKGTEIMASYRSGETANILGPLGRSYTIPADLEVASLVGGGLGVAPLPFLCEELLQANKTVEVFLGAGTVQELAFVDEFQQMGIELFLATEDGSRGKKGLVTDILLERLKQDSSSKRRHLFSCGPHGFLNSMINITSKLNIEGQLSIETMMGCGFGICVGCPVQVRVPKEGEKRYYLTCMDGPVFDAREIVLDD
ncbi:dihydroorotate dehydrogenase electron transfer subunit, partial [candidate division KSB1 bacterium]|nr:dihydroorotate dehydrogenase electron transfer subunit [candidate division KSB1 bacterium]NIR72798.1 dihydroorotate dehydrogenase electron transfer subunit [candidate division KSB1 bacterium]NIS28217.1 dihydroorotate dehydrogenase electron transfer subunit [candidate division KSB1 bacterium]NIT75108.1 dihydroorotate dehydrogenase electron transfer subunit [candidate division KSB1 bacterium]NIU28895.1 dihydroorotate dehydrogenase electron transfer subunit [candidate division KSB1 bacterium]